MYTYLEAHMETMQRRIQELERENGNLRRMIAILRLKLEYDFM